MILIFCWKFGYILFWFCSLIDIINFESVCSCFFEISSNDTRFIEYKKYVDSILDPGAWFHVLTETFQLMSKGVRLQFKKILIQPIEFKLINKRLNRLRFELMLYRVFCHLLFCVRGSQSTKRCQCCTRFFVNDHDLAWEMNKNLIFVSILVFLKVWRVYAWKVRGENINLIYTMLFLFLLLIIATKIIGIFIFEACNEPF